jgi:hypothetical protein
VELCDWIVGLYCLGCGVGLVVYWSARLMAHQVPLDESIMRHHLAAEFFAAAALIAAGIATLADARAPGTLVTVGLGLGLLVYAAVQSPALYPQERLIRVGLWVLLALTLAVYVYRVATL